MNKFEQKLLSIDSEPKRSNSSDGRWVVDITVSTPIGNGAQNDFRFFWKKKDAQTWIDTQKQQLSKAMARTDAGNVKGNS